MRFWIALLFEMTAFGCVTSGLLAGARHLQPPLLLAAPRPNPAPALGLPVTPRDVEPLLATTPAGTFLGMFDELLIGRMQHSQVKSVHFNRGGSSISFRVDFSDGSRAAFKPTQTNPQSVPRKEAAAYRLSRLLGLNLVAPSIIRPLSREEVLNKLAADSEWVRRRIEAETLFDDSGKTYGALSYWIPVVVDMGLDSTGGINRWTGWLSQGGRIPPEKVEVMAQLSTLLLFDLLQNNSDRFSGGNLLGAPDGKTLYYMDNAFGFQADPEGHLRCHSYLMRAQKFSRHMARTMQQLTKPMLKQALQVEPGSELLSDAEIDALLGRRDRALKYLRDLCNSYGEDRVLVFQ